MSHPSIEDLSESNGLTLSQNRTDSFDIFGTYTVIILQKYQDTIKILYNGQARTEFCPKVRNSSWHTKSKEKIKKKLPKYA